jgi:hypothetical protein
LDLTLDSSRAIWNLAIDHHPAVIVRCAGADDVARAVRFAGRQNAMDEHGIPVNCEVKVFPLRCRSCGM